MIGESMQTEKRLFNVSCFLLHGAEATGAGANGYWFVKQVSAFLSSPVLLRTQVSVQKERGGVLTSPLSCILAGFDL